MVERRGFLKLCAAGLAALGLSGNTPASPSKHKFYIPGKITRLRLINYASTSRVVTMRRMWPWGITTLKLGGYTSNGWHAQMPGTGPCWIHFPPDVDVIVSWD